jgi:hypothetical protein
MKPALRNTPAPTMLETTRPIPERRPRWRVFVGMAGR